MADGGEILRAHLPLKWHYPVMTTNTGTSLFEQTQRRLAEARAKVDALDVSDDVKRIAHRNLNRLDRSSRSELSLASRAVEDFHAALDAGEVPIYE